MSLQLVINLSDQVRESLSVQLEEIKREYPYFHWTNQEDYNVTLLSFGQGASAEKLIAQIEECIFDIPRTQLYVNAVRIFVKNNITLYLNFRRDKNLERLIGRIKDKCSITNQREFIPHVILAKYKLPSKQQYLLLKKKLSNLKIEMDFPVEKVNLLEVLANKEKPTYKEIAEFSLF